MTERIHRPKFDISTLIVATAAAASSATYPSQKVSTPIQTYDHAVSYSNFRWQSPRDSDASFQKTIENAYSALVERAIPLDADALDFLNENAWELYVHTKQT